MPVEPLPCTPGGGEPGPSCCAPSIASTPLCRQDGTTILLVLRSACACDGATPAPPEVAGWLDPATGTFTPGPAPADAAPCGADDCASVSLLRLCDQTPDGRCTPFLRHLVHDCTGTVTASTDTTADGTTPYSPAGTVTDCEDCGACSPPRMCPGFSGLSGPEVWTIPPGTESVQLTVVCGPVTVFPCTGDTAGVQVNEAGVSLGWSAPSGECQPGALCESFRVDIPEGSSAYISWLAAGCEDES